MLRCLRLCVFLATVVVLPCAAAMPCVIRVAGALAYLDVGTRQAVQAGDALVVLRQAPGGYAEVARVRVIRLAAQYSIAEIVEVREGEHVEVLQSALPVPVWDDLRALPQPAEPGPVSLGPAPAASRRWVCLVGGGEWGLRAADMGLRLGYPLARHWRACVTGRLGLGTDVRRAGVEADVHLVLRGLDRTGPYMGGGGSLQLLTWDAVAGGPDSARRAGAHAVVGLQLPGRWPLFVEAGYQRVGRWSSRLDVSHLRTYAGLGRAF